MIRNRRFRAQATLAFALLLAAGAAPALAQPGPLVSSRRGQGTLELGRERIAVVEAAVRLSPDGAAAIEVRSSRGETYRFLGTWRPSTESPRQHALEIHEAAGDPNARVHGWLRAEGGRVERIEINGRWDGGRNFALGFEATGADLAVPPAWTELDVTEEGWGELSQGDGSWGIRRLRLELRPDGFARLTALGLGTERREMPGRWSRRDEGEVEIELGESFGDRGESGRGTVRLDRGRIVSARLDGRDRRGPFRLEFRAGASAPYPNRPDPGRPHRDDFSEEWGYDQPGGDFERARAQDVAQCQQLCAEDSRCRAYTFNTRDSLCYLKDSERTLQRRSDCVTGVKRMGTGGTSERAGYDLEGGDYTSVYLPGLGDCQRACTSDRECAAYSYNTRTRMCFLKDYVGTYVPRPEMVSGVKPRAR